MTRRLDSLFESLENAITAQPNYIVCWSGGKDSTLIMKALNELGHTPPCLTFNAGWHDEQKGVIIGHLKNGIKAEIFFYRPSDIKYIDKTVISYYNIGGALMPLVTDYLPLETRCGIDLVNKVLDSGPVPNYIWDLTIVGSKSSDTHRVVPKVDFDGFDSTTEIYTPLWDWSDDDVLDACDALGVKFDKRYGKYEQWIIDSGNFLACMKCVRAEEPVYCFKIDGLTDPV